MKATTLAREWLLLGAESFLALPPNQVADVHQGFGVHPERWAALGQRLREHADTGRGDRNGGDVGGDDVVERRLRGKLGLGETGYWLVMLAAAIELYPEAAAAASILAEDERLALLTPSSAARLVRAALGIAFEDALGETLAHGRARRMGLIEVVEAVPGRPTTHQGLRLRSDELSAMLAGGQQLGAARAGQVTRVAPTRQNIHAARTIAGAARLAADRPLFALRSASSRAARQFALDLASTRGQDALFVTVGETLPELTEIGRLRGDGVVVLDLFGWPGEKPFPLSFVTAAADLLSSVVVLVGTQASTGAIPALTVPPLGREQSRRVWAEVLAASSGPCNGTSATTAEKADQKADQKAHDDLTWLSDRFRVGIEEARMVLDDARDRATIEGEAGPLSRERIATAVLAQGGGAWAARSRSSARPRVSAI